MHNTTRMTPVVQECVVLFMELNQLNRDINLLNGRGISDEASRTRDLDTLGLHLQGLSFERAQLIQRIRGCTSFKFDESMIAGGLLTDVESRRVLARGDYTVDVRVDRKAHPRHYAMMNRLAAERAERQHLMSTLSRLKSQKKSLERDNAKRRSFLDNLSSKVRQIQKSCAPLRASLLPGEFKGLPLSGDPSTLALPLQRLAMAAVSLRQGRDGNLTAVRVVRGCELAVDGSWYGYNLSVNFSMSKKGTRVRSWVTSRPKSNATEVPIDWVFRNLLNAVLEDTCMYPPNSRPPQGWLQHVSGMGPSIPGGASVTIGDIFACVGKRVKKRCEAYASYGKACVEAPRLTQMYALLANASE